eukprot:COSAG05_NODE_13508_length_427_cov_0.935976_1_plen_73_part_00
MCVCVISKPQCMAAVGCRYHGNHTMDWKRCYTYEYKEDAMLACLRLFSCSGVTVPTSLPTSSLTPHAHIHSA